MAERRFKVRVYVKSSSEPGAPAQEERSRAFVVSAPHADAAALRVRARLEAEGFKVHSVLHGPEGVIATVALVQRERSSARSEA